MSERPREGIYLDAALGVIGEQVEERIDEIVRRRRVRGRVGVAALGVLTLASGSVAAVAVTTALQSAAPAPDGSASAHTAQVRCIADDDIEAMPFFTVTYRAPVDAEVDEQALCLGARHQLRTDAVAPGSATPEELVAAAEEQLRKAADTGGLVVDEASYGVLPPAEQDSRTGTGVCVEGTMTTILLGGSERASGGLWTACPKADG